MDSWHDFSSASASASATIFAVLFAAVQFRHAHWSASRLRIHIVLGGIFELLLPVVASLIWLIPGAPWQLGAGLTGSLGWISLIVLTTAFLRHGAEMAKYECLVASLLPLSAAVYTVDLLAAFDLFSQSREWAAATFVWLIISGASESWAALMAPPVDISHNRE